MGYSTVFPSEDMFLINAITLLKIKVPFNNAVAIAYYKSFHFFKYFLIVFNFYIQV